MEQILGSEARTSPRSGFLEVPSVVLFLAGEGLNQGAMIADQPVQDAEHNATK